MHERTDRGPFLRRLALVVPALALLLAPGTLLYALVTPVELLVAGHLRTLLDDRREQRAIDALNDHVISCGFGALGPQRSAAAS